MELERLLAELEDEEKPLRHSSLVHFSGLTPEELEVFRRGWSRLSPRRRRQVVSEMMSLAEDNVELDFNSVFRLCLRDPDEEVREKAVLGLWECEERSLIPSLISLLREDPSTRVRAAAAQGLGKFASLAEEGKLLPRDATRVKEALLEVVRNPREPLEVRRRALEAVAPFNLPEVDQIIQEAYHSREPLLRQSGLYAMGRTGNPRWLPTILMELQSPDPAMRYEAAFACGALGEESVVPRLLPLLRDGDLQVRLAAIEALGAIGGPVAKRALLQCLRSPDEAVREAAQAALQEVEFQEDPLSFKFRL